MAAIESNNGQYTRHNSSAFGKYAIKPATAKELGYRISKRNEQEVAEKLYDKLNTIAKGNGDMIAYGWLMGYTGLKRLANKPLYYRPVTAHWHVKKYRRYINEYDLFIRDIDAKIQKYYVSNSVVI